MTAAGYVAFVVAAPVLDPILFGALLIIVGWKAGLIYLGVAFAAALGLAMAPERVNLKRFMKPLPVAAGSAEHSTPWAGIGHEWRPAWKASRALLRTMLPLLWLGWGSAWPSPSSFPRRPSPASR